MTLHAANPSHACALVVADELARCGVTDVVVAPGSRSTALALALHDEARIRVHVEIDERSAGFFAIGYARVTGHPAPVVVTSGTAVANLHPAVVEADAGGVPLLLLTADRPPELRHTGANQAIDQIGIFAAAPRWQVELGVPEDRPSANRLWRSTVGRAVAESRGLAGPPGPVHVNLPFREPTVPLSDDGRAPASPPFAGSLEGRADGGPWLRAAPTPRVLEPEATAALADRLAGHRRGVVVVGAGAGDPGPILALAGRLGWPVLAEAGSGARQGPQALAHAPLLLAHAGFAAAHRAAVALRFGRTGVSAELARYLDDDTYQIAVDPHGRVHDPERRVAEVVAAQPAALCSALTAALGPDPADRGGWLASWLAADAVAAAAVDEVLDADDGVSEPRAARDVAAAVPDGGVLVTASSMPIRDLDRFQRPRGGVRVVANRGASGVDGFVSTALGAAVAAARPIVALCGDLSLLHDVNGFLLDSDAAVDAVFVVIENDGGGIFSFLPQAGFTDAFERLFATPHGRSAADVAALHRLSVTTVTSASRLGEEVGAALAAGGVHLLRVHTDRAENHELHARLTAAVGAALDAACSPDQR